MRLLLLGTVLAFGRGVKLGLLGKLNGGFRNMPKCEDFRWKRIDPWQG